MDLSVLVAISALVVTIVLVATIVGAALTMIFARRDARKARRVDSGRIDRLERLATKSLPREIGVQSEIARFNLALDADSILGLYKQIFVAGRAPLSRDVEETRELNASASLPLGQFVPGFGRRRTSTQRALYAPENEPVRAVVAVEKHLQDFHSIRSIDLTSPIDKRPISVLLENFEASAARIGLDVPDEIKASLERAWEHQNRELSDQSLETLTGFVEVRADYYISSRESGDLLLEAHSSSDSKSSKLSLVCKHEHILDAARTVLVPGVTVRATCFGSVARWDKQQKTLVLLPISIYLS